MESHFLKIGLGTSVINAIIEFVNLVFLSTEVHSVKGSNAVNAYLVN